MKKFFEPIINFLKPAYRVWMKFAHILGKINTAILLTVFYFVFLGIAKLFVVITRKDLLDLKWKDRSTYWKKREHSEMTRDAFLKPF